MMQSLLLLLTALLLGTVILGICYVGLYYMNKAVDAADPASPR